MLILKTVIFFTYILKQISSIKTENTKPKTKRISYQKN